jgi:hypothetical protein
MDLPTQTYTPSAINTLPVDTSYSLFSTNDSVQKVLKPFAYDDLMDFSNTRHIHGEFKVFFELMKLMRQMANTDHHTARLVKYNPIAFKMNRYSDIIPCKLQNPKFQKSP